MHILPITDQDARDARLAPRIKAKLFANRDLPEGSVVAVRLNLNGAIKRGGCSYHLQTVHDRRTSGRALGYDIAVTIRNAHFSINEQSRQAIAEGRMQKHPMAGVIGELVHIEPDLSGVEVRFNPKTGPFFTRVDTGDPIFEAAEVTVFDRRCYVRN